MIIVGYSGIDNSVEFARNNPDLRPGEERMVQGLDSAATLVVDGKVIAAAEEERFCGQKHTGKFPSAAISFCLQEAGLSMNDIDFIAHGFNYRLAAPFYKKFDPAIYEHVYKPELQLRLCERSLGLRNAAERFISVGHHLAHAASAYFPSGYDKALCVVCDGMGELESFTAFEVDGGEFKKLAQVTIPNSIGILYSLVTRHLGFDFNADEYKLMGLAPYGDPVPFRQFFNDFVVLGEQGKFEIRYELLTKSDVRDAHFRDVLASFAEIISSPSDMDEMKQIHYDFAAAAQECVERVLLHAIGYWQQATGLKQFCMAGGVALNCTFNGKLIERNIFDRIYIQPAAGDDGTSLGAALFTANRKGEDVTASRKQQMPFYGPSSTHDEILRAVEKFRDKVIVTEFDSVEETACDAAEGVADDLVQAWFQGAMEFGPRALGNRTILANPASPDIKSRVNMIIKLREGFRPFAPAVNAEHAAKYFDIDIDATPFEYMLATCQVKPEWRDRLPGITHVDGSARVQTVFEHRNPGFYHLINEIGIRTGVYCTLNTSFNVMSQPMIALPDTAVETFLRVKIDRLYMGRVRLSKPEE
ncbi:MAG: carbamoyltransferase [Gammaproteobacteria bacterium]|nr:carbamoyltransferase [Gammaproteobacteria bacterium]